MGLNCTPVGTIREDVLLYVKGFSLFFHSIINFIPEPPKGVEGNEKFFVTVAKADCLTSYKDLQLEGCIL